MVFPSENATGGLGGPQMSAFWWRHRRDVLHRIINFLFYLISLILCRFSRVTHFLFTAVSIWQMSLFWDNGLSLQLKR